jgi:hypothetical protein
MADTTNSSGSGATPSTPRKSANPRSAASIRAQKAAATRKRNAAIKAAQETRTAARATATTAKSSTKTTRASARRTATDAQQTAQATTAAAEAEAKVRVNQVQQLAEKALLVQVGAGLTVRDNVVSTVKELRDTVSSPTAIQRRLTRYEQRGVKARNRFERQVRSTRTKFESDLRHRRSSIEGTVSRNRTRVEHDLRTAREDLSRQSGALGSRVEKLVTDAQQRIGSVA